MHWSLGMLIVLILAIFLVWLLICTAETCSGLSDSFSLVLTVGVLNCLVFALMIWSTVQLTKQWVSQFGENFQRESRLRLTSYLVVFSVSFLIRGTFDTVQYLIKDIGQIASNISLILIYFCCEWLPLFFIFWNHMGDFRLQRKLEGQHLSLMPTSVDVRKNSNLSSSFNYADSQSNTTLPLDETSKDSVIERANRDNIQRESAV